MFLKDIGGLFEVGRLGCRDKFVFSHDVVNQGHHVALEAQVAVCHDANKFFVVVNDGDTANVIFSHHIERVLDGRAAFDGDRVINHAVFSTFHSVYLTCLLGYRHVFVNNTDTALAGDGNGQRCLGDSIHSCRHKGNI